MTPKPQGADDRGWQSVGRALTILMAIGERESSVSLTDISNASQLTISTTHRILKGLEAREFVLRDPLTAEYSVGPAILRLARSALRQSEDGDLALASMPHMQHLRELTGETVGIHVLRGDQRVCIGELPSHQPIRMASGIGASFPLVGATGKVLLAYMPPEAVDRIVASASFQAASTIGTTPDDVRRSLAKIRRAGYATSDGETVVGASAFAVPVLQANGVARAAINITGPRMRWTAQRMQEHADAARAAASWLGQRLGRSPGGSEDAAGAVLDEI
jgi:DNA-binding IclR family transcriptional regulator